MSAYIADCEWRVADCRLGDPKAAARPWKSAICNSRGMTLPEILSAIAILSILFGLLFMPLMKAFGYMHTANTAISVQNSARTLFESVTREISDAIYIYDNCDDPTLASLIVVLPQGAGTNVSQVPATGGAVPILINPGPGLDYGVNTPVHVQYQIALTRSSSGSRMARWRLPPTGTSGRWRARICGSGPDQIAGIRVGITSIAWSAWIPPPRRTRRRRNRRCGPIYCAPSCPMTSTLPSRICSVSPAGWWMSRSSRASRRARASRRSAIRWR